MDHEQIFVLEFVALVTLSAALAVLLSWKTKKPAVALFSSLGVIAVVFGGLIIKEAAWPRVLPPDPIGDPYGLSSFARSDEGWWTAESNVRRTCNLVSLAAYLSLLGWSLRKLVHEGIRSRRGWRTVAGFLALALVTVSGLLFVVAEGIAARISGFSGTTFFVEHGLGGISIVLAIVLAAGWSISVAALILALFGKGWRRISSLILSIANVLLFSATLALGT